MIRHIKAGIHVNHKGKFFHRRKGKLRYISFEAAREKLAVAGVSGQDLEIVIEVATSEVESFLDPHPYL